MKRIEEKHPLAIRWFHWINFPVLAVMIWSGLLIYWANDIYHVRLETVSVHLFPSWFYHPGYHEATNKGHALWHLDYRLAEGMAWHFLFFWFFAINGILYVSFLALSGQWREIAPTRDSLRQAVQVVLHDLHLRKNAPSHAKYNGAQRLAYTSIVLMGAGSLVTGLAIYKPIQLSWITNLLGGYEMARFLHFWLTMGYVAFFVIHILQVIRAGWNNFRAMVTGYIIADKEAPLS